MVHWSVKKNEAIWNGPISKEPSNSQPNNLLSFILLDSVRYRYLQMLEKFSRKLFEHWYVFEYVLCEYRYRSVCMCAFYVRLKFVGQAAWKYHWDHFWADSSYVYYCIGAKYQYDCERHLPFRFFLSSLLWSNKSLLLARNNDIYKTNTHTRWFCSWWLAFVWFLPLIVVWSNVCFLCNIVYFPCTHVIYAVIGDACYLLYTEYIYIYIWSLFYYETFYSEISNWCWFENKYD